MAYDVIQWRVLLPLPPILIVDSMKLNGIIANTQRTIRRRLCFLRFFSMIRGMSAHANGEDQYAP